MKPLLLLALVLVAGTSAAAQRNPYLPEPTTASEPAGPAAKGQASAPAAKPEQEPSAPSLVLVGVRGPIALLRGPGGAELFVQDGQPWSYGGRTYDVSVAVGLSETVTLSVGGKVLFVVTAQQPASSAPAPSAKKASAAPSSPAAAPTASKK